MKSLLVLYPIQPYADALMFEKDLYAQIYQNLVSKRYPKIQKIWMMFSEIQSPEKPDMSQLWQGISIGKNDIVGACGVNFAEHCKKSLYPNPKKIIDACPQPIEKLIIGGFHFWDCVEKVARYAYRQGIDVTVDDDLTECFFWKVRNCYGIPSPARIPRSREKSMQKDRRRLIKEGGDYLKLVRKAREGKPWLFSI